MPSYRADIAKVVIGDAAAAPAAAPAAEAAPAAAPAGGAALPDSATPVFMPALSSTMTEGKIVQWTKNEGDKVSAGEIHCGMHEACGTAVQQKHIGRISWILQILKDN